jgi:hypothetical protein
MDGITITTEEKTRIRVDVWETFMDEPQKVWLNISVAMASISAKLTVKEAKELAAALIAYAEEA